MPLSESDKLVAFRWLRQNLAAQKRTLGSEEDLIGIQFVLDNIDDLADIPALQQTLDDIDAAERVAEIARLKAKLAKLENLGGGP